MTAVKKKNGAIYTGNQKDAKEAREKAFVEAFIANGGNACRAAESAGYSPGPSARVQSTRMLARPNIQAAIKARQAELAQKLELTTENVLRSLAQAVHFDPRKLYDESGNLKPINELDDDTAQALSGFEVTEERGSGDERGQVIGYTKKVKWLDKNTARDQAMRHLGLFDKDNKQKNPLDGLSNDTLKAIVAHLGGVKATVGRA